MSKPASLGIRRVEALHYFVHDITRMRKLLVDLLDFREIGGSTQRALDETGHRTRVFDAGAVRILVSEPVGKNGTVQRFLERHPEGVGALVFAVADAKKAFDLLVARGATPLDDLEAVADDSGTFRAFVIATPFGDTTFRFVERKSFPQLYPNFDVDPREARGGNQYGFTEVDHVTSNFATLAPAALWLEHVLGFEKFWEVSFHTRDVAPDQKEGSGLKSIVHKDPRSPVKFADNEPLRPNYLKSQIHVFTTDHGGDGVQHAALATPDLVKTVRALVARHAPFLPTPGAYYDAMPERLRRCGVGRIEEDIDALRELGILVDGDKPGKYLLQIFMKDMASLGTDREAGPFFIELIQRKGDEGFGYGNFRALFESIERAQKAAGRI